MFALASRREGCCNALLEALSSGVPAVVTRVGDNDMYVKDRVSGCLVEAGDSTEFATALDAILHRRDSAEDQVGKSVPVGGWDQVGAEVLGFMQTQLASV